jgi:hypothetical protein
MRNRASRMLGVLAVTLAAAVVVGSAAAAEHPNDRAGVLGVGGVSASDGGDRVVIPNDRGGLLGVGSIEAQALAGMPAQPDDRGGLRRSGAAVTEAQSVKAPAGDGFQWADAAFGAAAALGIVLLGIAGVGALRRAEVSTNP